MVSFLQGLENANKAINCFLLGAGGNILGGVANLPGGSPEFVENTTKALRRLAGCDPADDPVLPPPPFPGGQCVGAGYTVTISTGSVNATRSVLGPISGVCFGSQQPPFNVSWGVQAGNGCILSGPGTATIPQADRGNVTITNIVRQGGLPDDCGNPPVVFPPAGDTFVDAPVTYITEEGDEITVNIPFVYAPIFVDVNGNFRIPFTFEAGGIEFSGDVTVAPEFKFTVNPPPAPRGTNSPITNLPGPDDEIPVEPSTFAERVVGVVVQSQLVGEQQLTTIFTENIPQILAPRCGSVKFGYAIAGRSFWSPDIDIKDLNCFIPCPFSQGADTVAASPAPGVVLNYVPIFGAPLATVADLGSTPEP